MVGKGVRAGKAYVEMNLDATNMQKGMRVARRSMKQLQASVGLVGGALAGLATARGLTELIKHLKQATDAAGNFAEVVAKLESVFGAQTTDIRAWGEELAETLGVSRREILKTVSGFQDLLVPMGMAEGVATGVSKEMTQLAIDLASFNNMRVEDVVRDLQAALTGSSETMKKYGSIVNVAAMNQELLNQEIDPKTADESQKAYARFQKIMKDTETAQGDAAKTAGSYNNQVKRLSANFEKMQEQLGAKLLPVLADVMQVTNEALTDIGVWVDRVIPAFEGLDKVILRAAKRGDWETVGKVIGMQVELGFRRQFGDPLVDLLKFGLKTSSGIGLLGTQGGRFAADVAGNVGRTYQSISRDLLDSDIGFQNPYNQQRRGAGSGTERIVMELERIGNVNEEQVKLEERNLELIQQLEGLTFQ